MKIKLVLLLGLFLFAFSCQNKKQAELPSSDLVSSYEVKYAKGFSIKKYADYTLLTVNDPWNSTRILQNYVLVDRDKALPDNLPAGTLLRTPLKSLAVYSTIHCAILQEFNSLDIIKAVCEPEYIDVEYVKEGVKNNTIVDIGTANAPDIEKLILVDPEAVMTSPIEGMSYGNIEKTGIPIIEIPDYMEATPLGRAEWLRFYALFIGQEDKADSLFKAVEKEYNDVKAKIATVSNRPTVFTDLKYGNVWYITGGDSFIANLLKDAGANYIWADIQSTGALPMSFEAVLDKAGEADIWLVKYNQDDDITYKALEKEYKAYAYFKAFKDKNIYTCNTKKKLYYETIAIHPEEVLKNFAYIFHPQLFPDYEPEYYGKMLE